MKILKIENNALRELLPNKLNRTLRPRAPNYDSKDSKRYL